MEFILRGNRAKDIAKIRNIIRRQTPKYDRILFEYIMGGSRVHRVSMSLTPEMMLPEVIDLVIDGLARSTYNTISKYCEDSGYSFDINNLVCLNDNGLVP